MSDEAIDPEMEMLDMYSKGLDFKAKLHTARYCYHCQIKHKYLVMSVLPHEQAAEQYRLAMENYDSLIAEAVNGHLTEANELEMAKGVGE